MSDRGDFEQRSRVLSATYDFVDWINSLGHLSRLSGGATIPNGYHYSVDTPGKRFVRIVMHTPSRSVHAFVDLTTGDLLKAAGWKEPAKGARGNLLTGQDEVRQRFDWSGHYLYKR
jgi:hypothetical protein